MITLFSIPAKNYTSAFCMMFCWLFVVQSSLAQEATPPSIVINEVFVDGTSNYPDWIELYNQGDMPVSLEGYILTRNLEEQRWTIQTDFILAPKEFMVFYCDKKGRHAHTSFRLPSITGEVGLLSPEGDLIDSITYDNLPRFTSLGRWPDGNGSFYIHASPTKGAANQESAITLSIETNSPITFSHPTGKYPRPFAVNISVPEGLQATYTRDGSIPEATSPLAKGPIELSQTTVIRVASTTQNGKIVARATRSYIINEPGELPVFSVVTDPPNLWDPEIGIYAEGFSPTKRKQHNQNWRNNWRRPVHIDFISGTDNWSVEGKVRIFGGASRGHPQKSLGIYTTDKREHYGLRQQLFPDVERERYAGFILRNGGDAWMRTQIRDAFIQTLVENRVACDTQPYRPVTVYLNGSYWGIYGLREFMIRKNLLARHGLPVQRITLMEGGRQVASAEGPFAEMLPVSAEGDYRQALSQVDIDAFLDYLVVELYAGNPDWPDGNIKAWRPESREIKWQWVLFDLDRAFNGKRGKGPDQDPFNILYAREKGRGLMFEELASNKLFVRDFSTRLVVHMHTTFNPARAAAILDSMTEAIRPDMPRHINRWRWSWELERLLMTMDSWEQHLEDLLQYCRLRPAFMLAILDKRFGVGKPLHTSIRIDSLGEGRILAEGVPLENGILQGPIPKNMEISISAVPAQGYVFHGWKNSPENKQPHIRINAGETFTDCALFKPE